MTQEIVPEPRKSGMPKRRRIAVGLGCLVATLAVAGWFLMREPQLTDRAARVTNVTRYAWIDDHHLLWAMPNSAQLSRIDLLTHEQHIIENINALEDAKTWTGIEISSVAPGGNRALTSIERPSSEDSPWHPAPQQGLIDLAGRLTRELDAGDSAIWLPDGRRWLALGPARSDRYSDQNTPIALWLRSADAPNRKVGPMPVPQPVKALLGVTPDNRLVMTDLTAGIDQPSITVWQRGVFLNNAPERKATLPAPTGWFYREAALSPAGDHVAYLLTSSRVPPLIAFVGRFLPGLVKNVKATRTFQIRASRVDGGDIREIGFQEAGKDSNVITRLKWNPDGKRLSFVFGNDLFVVPAR